MTRKSYEAILAGIELKYRHPEAKNRMRERTHASYIEALEKKLSLLEQEKKCQS